mgnify:CR=1 FL=1
MEDLKDKDVSLIEAKIEELDKLLFPNMSLDDVAEKYSPRVDDVIRKNETEGFKFSAGKFKIACVDDKSFALSYELYFKDKDGEWLKVANTSKPMNAKIWLSELAWGELLGAKEKVFDVAAPEFDTNGKVDF